MEITATFIFILFVIVIVGWVVTASVVDSLKCRIDRESNYRREGDQITDKYVAEFRKEARESFEHILNRERALTDHLGIYIAEEPAKAKVVMRNITTGLGGAASNAATKSSLSPRK